MFRLKKEGIIVLLIVMGVIFIPEEGTSIITPSLDVWDVGDWITYELLSLKLYTEGLNDLFKLKYIVSVVATEYVEFTSSLNLSKTRKLNVTGHWIDDQSQNITALDFFPLPIYVNTTLFENATGKLTHFENITDGTAFYYKTNTPIKVDGVPILIPVIGIRFETTSYPSVRVYNDTTGSYDTFNPQRNISISYEIHEHTGIMIRYYSASYTNYSASLHISRSSGWSFKVFDSHGVFELNTNWSKTKTSQETTQETTGLIFNISNILAIYLILRRRKERR